MITLSCLLLVASQRGAISCHKIESGFSLFVVYNHTPIVELKNCPLIASVSAFFFFAECVNNFRHFLHYVDLSWHCIVYVVCEALNLLWIFASISSCSGFFSSSVAFIPLWHYYLSVLGAEILQQNFFPVGCIELDAY